MSRAHGSAIDGRLADTEVLRRVTRPNIDYPVRRLNAEMWGMSAPPSTTDGDARTSPVKLAGCGRPVSADGWTPLFAVDNEWRSTGLSRCGSVLCDHCSYRVQVESRERYLWHFEDWLAGGGQLLHVRLSAPTRRSDDLDALLAKLKKAEQGLRRSAAWRNAGIVDWVRVTHIRWSRAAGWYPHFHVTAFIRPGFELDVDAAVESLRAAWKDRLVRAGFQRTSKRNGLFARLFRSALDAVYAWSWAEDSDDDDGYLHPQRHLDDVHDYSPGDHYEPGRGDDDDDGSWSVWDVARSAIAGDATSWRLWRELCLALKGVPVVKGSPMLSKVWASHLAEVEAEPERRVSVPEPVVLVGNQLVSRAVRSGVFDRGLRVGPAGGVVALAEFWSEALGGVPVVVDVDDRGVPLVWADDLGPPGGGGPLVSVLCSDRDLGRQL